MIKTKVLFHRKSNLFSLYFAKTKGNQGITSKTAVKNLHTKKINTPLITKPETITLLSSNYFTKRSILERKSESFANMIKKKIRTTSEDFVSTP